MYENELYRSEGGHGGKSIVKDWTNDFQTPDEVCKYMVSMLTIPSGSVLEPTPGKGGLVRALEDRFLVTAPENYFLLDKDRKFDAVVMNPPFSSRYAFLEGAPDHFLKTGMRFGYEILKQCMDKAPEIIALMPWFTLSDSDLRLRYPKKFGMVSITALPRKTFRYARIQTVVIHLVKGYPGETLFKVFEFSDPLKSQGVLF